MVEASLDLKSETKQDRVKKFKSERRPLKSGCKIGLIFYNTGCLQPLEAETLLTPVPICSLSKGNVTCAMLKDS